MKPDLLMLEQSIGELPIEELPVLVGDLARLQSLVALRIATASAAPSARPAELAEGADHLLSVEEVAKRLGRSPSWVYRHKADLPFYRSLPGGRGGFSEAGLARYLRRSH